MSGWWLQAACRGRPTSWFYPERGDHFAVAVARALCGSCPVRSQCLEACLDEELVVGDPVGIRGGLTAQERRPMLQAMRSPVFEDQTLRHLPEPSGRSAWPSRGWATSIM